MREANGSVYIGEFDKNTYSGKVSSYIINNIQNRDNLNMLEKTMYRVENYIMETSRME
jgi:hypothetical protein